MQFCVSTATAPPLRKEDLELVIDTLDILTSAPFKAEVSVTAIAPALLTADTSVKIQLSIVTEGFVIVIGVIDTAIVPLPPALIFRKLQLSTLKEHAEEQFELMRSALPSPLDTRLMKFIPDSVNDDEFTTNPARTP